MNDQQFNSPTKSQKRFRSTNGSNRIYRDGNRYKLKDRIDLPDGRKIEFVGSGKTRSTCLSNTKKLRAKKLAEIESTLPDRELLIDYCYSWLQNFKSLQGLKMRTLQGYEAAIRNHIAPHLNSLELRHTTRESIQKLYADLQRSGKTFYSLKEVRAVLCGALDEAVNSGLLPHNPARKVKLPKRPKLRPVHFTPEEVKKVIEVAGTKGEVLRWSIAFLLGLRQGECLALTWDHVELEGTNPHIKIRRNLSRVSGKGLVIAEPKTQSSNRDVPLSQELVELFRHHRLHQREKLLQQGVRWRETTHVFTTPTGQPIDPANDRKSWIRLLRSAGVPYRKLHAARHTTATIMHANNVPLLTISHILGHSSIATTAEFYAHVEIETKRKAVAILEMAIT